MEDPVRLLARAYAFAARAHVDHRCKGVRAEPYVNHLCEVAELVAEASAGCDAALVAAAVLHDVVEDCGVSLGELETLFGKEVRDLVEEVSDEPGLDGWERKRRQLERAPALSPGARRIKIADKISNLRALLTSPPEKWDGERKRAYLRWAREVVDAVRGSDPELESRFDEMAEALAKALDNPGP